MMYSKKPIFELAWIAELRWFKIERYLRKNGIIITKADVWEIFGVYSATAHRILAKLTSEKIILNLCMGRLQNQIML